MMRSLFSEVAAPVPSEQPTRAKDTTCWHPGGCWQIARKKHLCEDHMWEGEAWTRETVVAADGTSFSYIALRVMPPPMDVSSADMQRAALEAEGLKAER